METGIAICSVCGEKPVEAACLCEYPLILLCCEDTPKHAEKKGFHFAVPVATTAGVSKANFRERQSWLFGLNSAQETLRRSVTAVDTYTEEVERAFAYIQNQLEDIKKEHMEALRVFRAAVEEMVEAVIAETSRQALSSPPQLSNPLSELVLRMANPTYPEECSLYHTCVRIADEDAVKQLITVQAERLSPVLPELPTISTRKANKALALSGPFACEIRTSQDRTIRCSTCSTTMRASDVTCAGCSLHTSPTLASEEIAPHSPAVTRLRQSIARGRLIRRQFPESTFTRQHSEANALRSPSAAGLNPRRSAWQFNLRQRQDSRGGSEDPSVRDSRDGLWSPSPARLMIPLLRESRDGTESEDSRPTTTRCWDCLSCGYQENRERTCLRCGRKPESGNAAPMDPVRRQARLQPIEEGRFLPFRRHKARRRPDRKRCVVCKKKFTEQDCPFSCPGACRCRRCTVEAITDTNAETCIHCKESLTPEVRQFSATMMKRCHICEIAVDKQEIVPKSPCDICWKCVGLVHVKRMGGFFKMTKGICRLHLDREFDINVDFCKKAQMEFPAFACCCSQSNEDRVVLDCGHYVCRTHEEHLKFCRSCQSVAHVARR